MSERSLALRALIMSTVAFSLCFACWVINAVLVTYLVSAGVFAFDDSQVGWLLAMPILTGALSRVPLGLLTDRFGGRGVFFILMLLIALGLLLLAQANSYTDFIMASLVFGLAGGSFAVGIGYVSVWFDKKRQGTALGIFGMGNAGAAITTILAPHALNYFTDQGTNLEGWRSLPQAYAVIVILVAIAFLWLTQSRVIVLQGPRKSLADQLAPLRSIIVWRFGFYYFLVFGSFVSLAQWIVPYSVSVYHISLAQAGLLAAVFSFPSGVIRAGGGWLSDHFGARSVMYGVFLCCILLGLLLSIPKMDIESPGKGVLAKEAGTVSAVNTTTIVVGSQSYPLTSPPTLTLAELDQGEMMMPQANSWQVPLVTVGEEVAKKQLLAEGITNIYYPANLWIFVALVFGIGIATGIGKAAVYKFIPDQFPDAVGTVGGMVGLLGALGGFFFPPLWGYLLEASGLWSSCWMVLVVVATICLIWMHIVVRRIMQDEAPDLAQLVEHRPGLSLPHALPMVGKDEAHTIDQVLQRIPFFDGLSNEERKELALIGHHQSVPAGQILFEEGDHGDVLYVILHGGVKVFRHDKQGSEIPICHLLPGDFFGELALIDGKPRSAQVTTVESCELFLLGRQEFLGLVSKSPHMLADLLVGMSSRIRQGS